MAGFLATVRTEVGALDVSRRALRRFGLSVGSVLLAVAGVSAWRHGGALSALGQAFAGAGGGLVVLGAAIPGVLGPLYRVWMTAALAVGFVMTRVILTLAFGLVFVPVGLLFRLIGRDVLHQRPDPSAPSYWIRRTGGPSSRERMERMY